MRDAWKMMHDNVPNNQTVPSSTTHGTDSHCMADSMNCVWGLRQRCEFSRFIKCIHWANEQQLTGICSSSGIHQLFRVKQFIPHCP